MKPILALMIIISFALPVVAFDFGNRAPDKPIVNVVPPPADPAVIRQGGDTILDPPLVTLPASENGTTVGYNDDYDETCPYSGSTSPDVVYTFVADGDMLVDIDLFGSTYDTKVYVYDENLALIACNDDFYPDYVSKIEEMPVVYGVQYFVVIDGYGGESGDYVLSIAEFVPPPPCIVECPELPYGRTMHENEPPLVDEYEDAFNGGCNSPEFGSPFQDLDLDYHVIMAFCGVSGWYTYQGSNKRDTDWLIVDIGSYGSTSIEMDAEQETYLFLLEPQDCGSVAVVESVICGPCASGSMYLSGTPGEDVWIWVGPTTFVAPSGQGNEYAYVMTLVGGCVATERCTLTGVKALFH